MTATRVEDGASATLLVVCLLRHRFMAATYLFRRRFSALLFVEHACCAPMVLGTLGTARLSSPVVAAKKSRVLNMMQAKVSPLADADDWAIIVEGVT